MVSLVLPVNIKHFCNFFFIDFILLAGIAIGITGDAGVRATAQQPRMFVGMILILIFAEVLGLYGLIVALILNTKASGNENVCN